MKDWQDRNRLLLEHASDVVFTADAHGLLDWVSPSIRKITGEPPEHLLGNPITEFIVEDERAPATVLLARLLRGEEVDFVGRVVRSAVRETWVAANVGPLRDDNGTIIGIVGTARDVTDVVHAREAERHAVEAYEMLAEHMNDVVFRLDPQLYVRWVSPSVERVLGHPWSHVAGQPIEALVDPGDWAALAVERHQLSDPEHPLAPDHPMVLRARHADGTLRWMSSRPSPMTDADGRLLGIVTTWSDVQDLVLAREIARSEHERLRATLDSLLDPHVLLDPVHDAHGVIIDFVHVEANRAACAYNRPTAEPLVGRLLGDVTPRFVFDELLPLLVDVVHTGELFEVDEHRFIHQDGTPDSRFVDLRATKVGDAVSHSWRDSTERHVYEQQLSHLATHDPLTGLANRASLSDELTRALSAAARSGRSVAAIMLDLDHFKAVNDLHGHPVGDELLRAASRRIDRSVRAGDLVARVGGDEFVVVMRDLEDSSEALRVAMRIVQSFRDPVPVRGNELQTTASVGVAISTPASHADELLREADDAMYRAKSEGRDRVSLYNEDLRVAASERVTLEAQLRPALDLGELAVHYQPEIDLCTGAVCAVEALLRWHHPSGELYPAARFIDLAEEMGVIVESGNWVVREACAQAARWAAHRLTMRVNLSKQQLNEGGLVTAFEKALCDSGLTPSSVCAEVSESALMLSTATAQRNLAALRDLGVRLAIDNFGTGYGALAYLRDLDLVKLDRTYVRDLETNDYARRLVSGIVALAQRIGLQVAAEGVETVEQVRLLRELGCTTAQGYVFLRALPADSIEPLLQHRFPVS